MDTVGKAVYGMGFLSIVIGLSLTVLSYFSEAPVNLAFFIATGITMIAANWLRHSRGDMSKERKGSDSTAGKNTGYIIVGAFIFAGLAIIGVPIATVLVSLAQEESEAFGEKLQTVSSAISTIGDAAGPAYYAFLLGVLYFLSPKTTPAST